jgi:hypothetical protein
MVKRDILNEWKGEEVNQAADDVNQRRRFTNGEGEWEKMNTSTRCLMEKGNGRR